MTTAAVGSRVRTPPATRRHASEAVLRTFGDQLEPTVAGRLAGQLPLEIGRFLTGVGNT